jgi:hypothetical protein
MHGTMNVKMQHVWLQTSGMWHQIILQKPANSIFWVEGEAMEEKMLHGKNGKDMN